MITLRENEKINSVKRKHQLILIRDLVGIVLIFLTTVISIFVTFFVSFSFPESLTETFPFLLDYGVRVFALYLLFIFLFILWQVIFIILVNYYLDCWIITDQRTIHTEIKALFNRTFSSVSHDKIQDVTVTVSGILPTFLRYGDLQIQTAGKFQEFVCKQIPEPYKTKEILFKSQKEYLAKKGKNRNYQ